jgi:hypothetical protein
MNEIEAYRREALKELKSNMPTIIKIAKSALEDDAKVVRVKPIGSVTNASKFNENSDVDIGIYVTADGLPAGMNEELSWKAQRAFMGQYFDVSGVLNTVVYVMDKKMNEDAQAQPITPEQLDMLERVVDKVFANLNIDVEFTKHFLDRVNDERNKKQITIRELGELFAKEYRRWGNTIKHMPVDSQAVMKDLSSAINIPFVLNKDGKEKDLVAKTVMRKKDFKSPDKQLPVESVVKEGGKKLSDVIPQLEKELNAAAGFDRNVFELSMGKRTRAPGPWGFGSAGGGIMIRWRTHGAIALANERGVPQDEVFKEAQAAMKNWLLQNTKPITVRDKDSRETKKFYIRGPLAFDWEVHYVRVNTKRMLQNPSRFEIQEAKHGAKTGSQVKGREPVPAKSKPSKGGETPHPMRGRLVGEQAVNEGWKIGIWGGRTTDGVNFTVDKLDRPKPRYLVRYDNDDKAAFDNLMVYYDDFETVMSIPKQTFDDAIAQGEQFQRTRKRAFGGANQIIKPVKEAGTDDTETLVYAFANKQRRKGWNVYVSRMAFRGPRDYMLEFEKDGEEFEIIGNGDHWELFFGPNLSGRGQVFSNLEDAFQTVMSVISSRPMDEGFGDPGTMTGLPGRAKWRDNTPKQSPDEWKAGNKQAYDDMVAYQRELYNRYQKSGKKPTASLVRAWRQLGFMEAMDQPPLDVETPTPATIAQKHGVDLKIIEDQLKMGLEVEMEHTSDPFAAMEIALDHLNEMPDYYTHLRDMEGAYTPEAVTAAWEAYSLDEKLIDPREAILAKALKYLDKKVQMDGGRQSLGGYAFDVGREINLSQLGITSKELARMYRDWKGDSVVTEGWMEHNLYYLDEVIREDEDPCWDGYKQIGMKKKKGKQVPNCVPKKKK